MGDRCHRRENVPLRRHLLRQRSAICQLLGSHAWLSEVRSPQIPPPCNLPFPLQMFYIADATHICGNQSPPRRAFCIECISSIRCAFFTAALNLWLKSPCPGHDLQPDEGPVAGFVVTLAPVRSRMVECQKPSFPRSLSPRCQFPCKREAEERGSIATATRSPPSTALQQGK